MTFCLSAQISFFVSIQNVSCGIGDDYIKRKEEDKKLDEKKSVGNLYFNFADFVFWFRFCSDEGMSKYWSESIFHWIAKP